MPIDDSNMGWLRKRKFISPLDMQGIVTDGTDLLAGQTAAALYVELAAKGMAGLAFAADGNIITGFIPVPFDLDGQFPIGFRIWWTMDHDGSGTANALFKLLQGTEKPGETISIPTAVLDTLLVLDQYNDTDGNPTVTDHVLQKTPRGIRTSIGLTHAEILEGAMMTFSLEMDSALNETKVILIGIEMDYTPWKCSNSNSDKDAPLTDQI